MSKEMTSCLGKALGNGIVDGGTTGLIGGARAGFARGLAIANRRAFVKAALIAGAVGAIGTFEVGGTGGPFAFFATRAIEYATVVAGTTVTYAVGGAALGTLEETLRNGANCLKDVPNAW